MPCDLHGQTHDQPGPRKKVPTTVKINATVTNQVITHQDIGRALQNSEPSPGFEKYDKNIDSAMTIVGIRTVQASKIAKSRTRTLQTPRNSSSFSARLPDHRGSPRTFTWK
jgi:hypothetical protein